MGFMPEDWHHHNISVPCLVQCNLMCPLNVEISCNDISFNFNYIMVVMYGTVAERCVQWNRLMNFLAQQFSHQICWHEKAPEFHHILMECCVCEIRVLYFPVWNEMFY